jgi:hypothetical protein
VTEENERLDYKVLRNMRQLRTLHEHLHRWHDVYRADQDEIDPPEERTEPLGRWIDEVEELLHEVHLHLPQSERFGCDGDAVWCVITSGGGEMEFFSSRPKTPGVGGEVGNWPEYYEVWVGNLDGGDAVLVEQNGEML